MPHEWTGGALVRAVTERKEGAYDPVNVQTWHNQTRAEGKAEGTRTPKVSGRGNNLKGTALATS